jgi:hypothetical protein
LLTDQEDGCRRLAPAATGAEIQLPNRDGMQKRGAK